MCSLGQATVDTPLIERLTLTNVFSVLRGTVIFECRQQDCLHCMYERSWVGERCLLNILTYLWTSLKQYGGHWSPLLVPGRNMGGPVKG